MNLYFEQSNIPFCEYFRDLVRCSVRLAADQVLLEADGLCYKALHLSTAQVRVSF